MNLFITEIGYFTKRVLAILCLLILSSCSYQYHDIKDDLEKGKEPVIPDYIDPALKLDRKQYRDHLYGHNLSQHKDSSRNMDHNHIPDFPSQLDLISDVKMPELGNGKLITLSITDDIPIKEVFMEISRLSEVDIELGSDIEGGVILRVTNRPLGEVVERISRLSNLRYSVDDGVIRIEKDQPYLVNYPVTLLNLDRSNESNVSISTSVLGSGGDSGGSSSSSSSSSSDSGSGGGSFASGSSNTITSTYDGNIWSSIEASIQSILSYGQSSNSEEDDEENNNIDGTSEQNISNRNFLSVNRQAGIISVMADSRTHKNIREYLNQIILQSKAQVLIEAKILEVTLNDQYRAGINWNSVIDSQQGLSISGDFNTGENELFTISGTSLFGAGRNLSAAISLTEEFGTSKTLSSPRLLATNNQQAVLTFAENQAYFTLSIEREDEEATDNTGESSTFSYESELNTIPIGVILTLQPSIDLDSNEVVMNVRPTLSRITEQVEDPGVTLFARQEGIEDITSTVPVVEVREMDSVLRIKSGEVMVIGGLMEERVNNSDRGLPGVSSIPAVGNLFKSVNKTTSMVETVIFLKATIIRDDKDTIHIKDKHLYNVFSKDSRRVF